MIYKLFTIYDEKVQAYLTPLFMRTKGEAIRNLTEVVNNDKQSNLCKFPEDYSLYELGEFDDSSGGFALHATPLFVGKAVEFVKAVN